MSNQPKLKKHYSKRQRPPFLENETSETAKETTLFQLKKAQELPKHIKTRSELMEEVQTYMNQNKLSQEDLKTNASAKRIFKPRHLPAYFKKETPTFRERLKAQRNFYKALEKDLEKRTAAYILFDDGDQAEQETAAQASVSPSKKANFPHEKSQTTPYNKKAVTHRGQRHLEISLQGIIDEETKSLKQQQKRSSSLFPNSPTDA